MKGFRHFCVLALIAAAMGGQAAAKSAPAPEALVERLYRQVVARHPLGVPHGADMEVFAPYLSKRLLHRFDLSNRCFADWRRRYPDPDLKPDIGMFEDGVFSGETEKAEPTSFRVLHTRVGKRGASRVYVRLAWDSPPEKTWIWYVAAVVVRENGRPVVDDIVFLKNKSGAIESRLSQRVLSRCDGARYTG
jgi:hypothetical protein